MRIFQIPGNDLFEVDDVLIFIAISQKCLSVQFIFTGNCIETETYIEKLIKFMKLC